MNEKRHSLNNAWFGVFCYIGILSLYLYMNLDFFVYVAPYKLMLEVWRSYYVYVWNRFLFNVTFTLPVLFLMGLILWCWRWFMNEE